MYLKQSKIITPQLQREIINYYLSLKKVKILKAVLTIVGIFFIAFSIFITIFLYFNFYSIITFLFGLFFTLYPNVIYPKMLYKTATKNAKYTVGMESEIIVTDDKITLSLPNEKSEYNWSSVVDVVETKNYIIINANGARNLMLAKDELTQDEYNWILQYKERI